MITAVLSAGMALGQFIVQTLLATIHDPLRRAKPR
jgi:hypothetical protein